MKANQKVITPYGLGTIVKREGNEGILKQRWIVKLDNCPDNFKYLQSTQGGLAFNQNELKKINK